MRYAQATNAPPAFGATLQTLSGINNAKIVVGVYRPTGAASLIGFMADATHQSPVTPLCTFVFPKQDGMNDTYDAAAKGINSGGDIVGFQVAPGQDVG